MAQTYKRLGAINPSANTQTNVYVVPTSTEAVVSTITVCNQSASNASYSIAVATNGEADNVKHYLIRGGVVPASDSIGITLGITIDAADVVRGNTNSSSISFNIFGSEIA